MNQPMLTVAETARANLRLAAAMIEKNLSAMTAGGDQGPTLEALRESWRAFVALLALEAEPERRECPFCRGPIRIDATRCVHCWKRSSDAGCLVQRSRCSAGIVCDGVKL